MTTLKELRRQKRHWLENTLSKNYLKSQLKLSEQEIASIESEVRYSKERFDKKDVDAYLDRKVKNDENDSLLTKPHNKQQCPNCGSAVNKSFIGLTGVCRNCEIHKVRKTTEKLNQVAASQRIKPKGNQMTI